MDDHIRFYWGKARPVNGEGVAWHPLAYHSLDVAAAMSEMLEARPAWLMSVARGAGLASEETRKRLILVAAFHDLGKFAENFQWKVPDLARKLRPDANPQLTSPRGHGDIGHAFWNWLLDAEEDNAHDALASWVKAAVAHHGAPTDGENVSLSTAMSLTSREDASRYMRSVTSLFGVPSSARPAAHAETWRVAGLVILADWIGSNQEWFPYEPPDRDLANYWPTAQEKARRAIAKSNLGEAVAARTLTLSNLIDGAPQPSPLQRWALDQPPPAAPSLYIIEDLTGSGKTEAALILAHRLMAAGLAEGLYWALPTMATANGLYDRLENKYQRLFSDHGLKPSLVLAHSARDLNTPFQASIAWGVGAHYGAGQISQDQAGEAHCSAFVAEDRKKSFLAQVGVGTLDQALLAVLPARHQSLRLAALSRRVLIIDEAHAYDPYMNAALETLLAFQGSLGGSAIVLSATLTGNQRRKLAATYNSEASKSLCEAAFPLVTLVTSSSATEEAQVGDRGARRDLVVQRRPTPEAAMDTLLDSAGRGLCGAYVRNTVADALEAMDYLNARKADGVTVTLFHARFALGDRLKRESDVMRCFGKHSSAEARRGQILVATQVVEQSLDLDFDCMATDLCPMDLLIQRAGRLQRHGHRPMRPAPVLYVVGPSATDSANADWYGSQFSSAQYVYPDVGQLWRTQRLLETLGGLPLLSKTPRDLLEPVFGEAPMAIPPGIEPKSDSAVAGRQVQRAIGRQNVLDINRFERGAGFWESDTRTPTRLGEPSVVARLARWKDGVLTPWFYDPNSHRAWRLSELSLRVSQFSQAVSPDDACNKAIDTTQQGWAQKFDPPPILALIEIPRSLSWSGRIADGRQRVRDVGYSSANGLTINN